MDLNNLRALCLAQLGDRWVSYVKSPALRSVQLGVKRWNTRMIPLKYTVQLLDD